VAVLERLAASQETIAEAVKTNADTNLHLAGRMDQLVATIRGAQAKIGGQVGPALDRVKAQQKKLEEETAAVIASRGQDHA